MTESSTRQCTISAHLLDSNFSITAASDLLGYLVGCLALERLIIGTIDCEDQDKAAPALGTFKYVRVARGDINEDSVSISTLQVCVRRRDSYATRIWEGSRL